MAKGKLEVTFGWKTWLKLVLAGYAVFGLVWLTMWAFMAMMGVFSPSGFASSIPVD